MKIERFWKSNWVSDNKEQKAKAKWAMILRNKLKEKHGTGNIKLCIYSQKKATVPYICFPLPLQHTWSWSRFLPGRFPPYFIEAWEITERTWGAPGEHWTRNYFCRLYKKFPSDNYLISQGVQWLWAAEEGQALGADTEINPCQPDPPQAQHSQHGWARAKSRRCSQCFLSTGMINPQLLHWAQLCLFPSHFWQNLLFFRPRSVWKWETGCHQEASTAFPVKTSDQLEILTSILVCNVLAETVGKKNVQI